jgi:hypothetical protein
MANPFSDLGVDDDDFYIELNSEEVLKARIALANKARIYWRRIAPVGDPAIDPNSGTYRNSIKVTVDGNDVSVGSDDPKANIIEFGTEDTPEFACRAQTQARFKLSEGD